MRSFVVKNIAEFEKALEHIKTKEDDLWFRGHSGGNFLLEPSSYRFKKIITGDEIRYLGKSSFLLPNDVKHTDFFRKYCNEKKIDCPQNTIQCLFKMQHYGIPTRLLDFSTDPMVALFFAVSAIKSNKFTATEKEIENFYENEGYSEMGSAVYCISPSHTNMHTLRKNKIINSDQIDERWLSELDFPIAIQPNFDELRIRAQSGVFLLFGYMVNPYEYYEYLSAHTYKIFVPNSCRSALYKELKTIKQITPLKLFPDIEGISRQIKDELIEDLNDTFERLSVKKELDK